MIKFTNPPPLPPPIRLIFLSYDLNSSSSKVHFRRILQEKTEHNKERIWKFKTTVEPDKPNNIRRQRRGSYVPPCPLRNTGAMKQSSAVCRPVSQRAQASKRFWTQACERARISGGKQRTESAHGKKRRRRRIDWLYTYSYISRVYTFKHFKKNSVCFVLLSLSLSLRGNANF